MQKPKILVVEDSRTQAMYLKLILESNGYEVFLCENGKSALDWLAEQRPELIISDVLMPLMNGFELCKRLKSDKQLETIPVILLTSLSDEKDIILGLASGANSFISKPYDVDHLGSIVRNLIKGDIIDPEIQGILDSHSIKDISHSSINFLLSAYKTAIIKNIALERSEQSLKEINRHLEDTVLERTKELEKAKRKAEKSDRLKSVFLSNVSHDLRTPMNAIMGFSELLREEDLTEKQKEEYHDLISTNGDNLLKLINDIIDISKIEAGVIKCDLDSDCLINDLLEELEKTFNKNKHLRRSEDVKIVFNRKGIVEDLVVKTDSFRLRQILSNLTTNAVKFTSKGSIEFSYRITNNGYIEFLVKDTGIGIPKSKVKGLFKRYEQIKTSNSPEVGTGLGLAIAENLARILGGKMWIESELGVGSRFYFTIPYIQSKEESQSLRKPRRKSREKFDLSNVTILIVEDDEYNYKFLENTLSRLNARLLWACDGEQAIDFVQQYPEIQVVLMDIGLPKMNGFVATRKIVKLKNSLPVIAQTAYALSEDEESCYSAGCVDYISKPVDPVVLVMKINNAILEAKD